MEYNIERCSNCWDEQCNEETVFAIERIYKNGFGHIKKREIIATCTNCDDHEYTEKMK